MSQIESTGKRPASARALREAATYDEGLISGECGRWLQRVPHVFQCPNTKSGEDRFSALLRECVKRCRAVDLGCSDGTLSAELHAMGAASVLGIDVSQREIDWASERHRDLPDVSFLAQSVEEPISGDFELIAGRSILHHIDFREALPRLFAENLLPGGRMVFMEPMGHPLTLAFHRFARSAHTEDEWPITPPDVAWLRRRFAAKVIPVNLVSFPAGVLSSIVMASPNNVLMRLADRVDQSLERRRHLMARGRQGIIVIDKPGAGA